MASPIRGITIQIEGDATPLTQALRSVDDASRSTTKELGQINRALRFDEGNSALLAQRFDVLQDAVRNTQGRLETLQSAQEDVNRAFASGEIDASQYRAFQREIETTQSRLRNFQEQAEATRVQVQGTIELTGLAKARQDLSQLADEARQAGSAIGAGLAAGAAAGTAALAGVAVAGQDVAQRLAALEASASTLGFDTASGQLNDLVVQAASYTGDIEGAIEAVSNLASTDLSQGQLGPTLELLTGAALQFRETLNLEGIADGFQETLAIGEGAGSFIEFLERSGVNLDDFNDALAAAKEQGTELDFVLGVLGGTNAQGVVDAFTQQNQALINSQKAQAELAIATSELSIALAPLTAALAGIITSLAEFASENQTLTTAIAIILPVLTALLGIFAAIGAALPVLTPIFGAVGAAIAGISAPVAIAVASIGAIIAIVGLVASNVEPLGELFSNIFGGIQRGLSSFIGAVRTAFSRFAEIITRPINSVIGIINKFIKALNKLKLPDFLGGGGINIPTIPAFARGTNYFRGGTALVGEEGPELVNLPGGSSVVNARNTQRSFSQEERPLQISIPIMLDGRQVASATALYTNREIYNISENNRRGGRTR